MCLLVIKFGERTFPSPQPRRLLQGEGKTPKRERERERDSCKWHNAKANSVEYCKRQVSPTRRIVFALCVFRWRRVAPPTQSLCASLCGRPSVLRTRANLNPTSYWKILSRYFAAAAATHTHTHTHTSVAQTERVLAK